MRAVIAVAVTMLYDTHPKDVARVFSVDELSEMVSITAGMGSQQVEDIYKRAWDGLYSSAFLPLPGAQEAVALNGQLYAALGDLLSHLGAEGCVGSDHPFVWDAMTALKRIDGGVYLDDLAVPVDPDAHRDDMLKAVQLLEDGEWAEHFAKTPLGMRLEDQITKLHGEAGTPTPQAADTGAAQGAAVPAVMFGNEDHVLVPRGLIGAACSIIAHERKNSSKTLAELRRYTVGDLSQAQGAGITAGWDGKLSDRLERELGALMLECPPAIVYNISHLVRSECEALYTSLATFKRMYAAARDRYEALEAAATPQPAPPADSVLEDAAQESDYRRGYRHGYEQRDAEVRGALA